MNHPLSKTPALLAALPLLITGSFLQAKEDPVLDSIRYVESPTKEIAQLQTGTTRFQKNGVTVDLVGVVHIGDKEYFEDLNHKLSLYDAVLYEMVGGPVETRKERDVQPEMGVVHVMQKVMQNVLGLQYQLSGINYNQPHFIHADATHQQFRELMASRNESMLTMFARAMSMENSEEMQKHMEEIGGEELTMQMAEAVAEMNPGKFKRSMAPLLANSEVFIEEMSGEAGSVLITDRNKIVMEFLDRQIALGKKKIAIFYGAGHMPDFQKRLIAQGFHEQETTWDVAWHILENENKVDALGIVENLLNDEDLINSLSALFRLFTEQ